MLSDVPTGTQTVGSLIRRNSGVFYGVFSQDGKRVWRSMNTRSLEEAQAAFKEISREYVSYKRMTILQFRTHLLGVLDGTVSEGTLDLYDRSLRSLLKTIGDRPLRSVNALQVDLFKGRRSKDVSLTTVSIEYRTLKAAFNRAVNYNFIERNPFMLTKNIILPDRDPSYITRDEFIRLLALVDNVQMRSIILLAVCTMIRLGELVNLRWSDVDLSRNTIRLTARKTKKPRTVFLNVSASRILAGLPHTAEYVFPKANGTKLCGRSISRLFKKYVRKAGLPEAIHYHSLRHTGATWLVQNNVPLPYVKEVLGHRNISTTMVYAHADAIHLQESVRTFDHYLEHQIS
jgi:integrase